MRFICVTFLIISGITDLKADQYSLVGPSASLITVAGEDVILPCSLKPNISAVDMRVEWFRVDLKCSAVVHLYEDHEDRNIVQLESYRGRTRLVQEEIEKGNTSLKLSRVQMSDQGLYKCFVQSQSWYDDITVDLIVEDGISWRTSVILISVAVLLCVISGILTAVFVYKKREQEHKTQSEDQRIQSEKRKIENEQVKLLEKEKKTVERAIPLLKKHAVKVTLDPDSAHPRLTVSPDGKQVRFEQDLRTVDDRNKEGENRFDKRHCVLGQEEISSGCSYFEVEVKELDEYHVGVARESANRKGSFSLKPEDGYWTERLRDKNFKKSENPFTRGHMSEEPQRVGVLVDYEEGQVSFYDLDFKCHIKSFTDQSFKEKLYPLFYLGPRLCRNSAPLTICSDVS